MTAIPADSRDELEKLERKHADNPEGRYFVPLANAYRKTGDLDSAISLLRRGLERHPDYLSAHIVLGRCYADRGDSAAADAEFRYVLSLDPQNLIALRTLGELALSSGRVEDARGWYDDLLSVDPMNEDARRAIESLKARGGGVGMTAEVAPSGLEAGIPADSFSESNDLPQPVRAPEASEIFEAQFGAVVDLNADAEGEPPFEDEADTVVTETIAELYTRQGFYNRAADVYRELIRRRGGDPALSERLRRVELLAAGLSDSAPTVPAPEPPVEELPAAPVSLTDNYPEDDVVGEPSSAYTLPELPEIEPASSLSAAFALPDLAQEPPSSEDPASAGVPGLLDNAGEYTNPALPEGQATPGARPEGDQLGSEADDLVLDRTVPLPASIGDQMRDDPFADSFADGFSMPGETWIEEEDSTRVAAQTAALQPMASGETIRNYLRAVLSWEPATQSAPEPTPEAPVSSAYPSYGEIPTSGEPDLTLADPVAARPPFTEDAAPSVPSDLDEPSPSGVYGLSGGSDLFPWELPPAPETQSEGTGPVSPIDLDPGFPFAASSPPPAAEPPSVSYGGFDPLEDEDRAPLPDPAPTVDPVGPASTPTPAPQDDDDLESFQAWLRSLKR